MPESTQVFGFLNINKPLGMTSHDVINAVRRGLRIKKAGHAGTLDPMATGVLIVCLGAATRLSEYAMASQKHYRARVYLGKSTETYDAEGDVVSEHDASHITQAQVEAVLPQFTGDIQQFPPMYSAIKRGGKKLYELAREGKTVELEARAVTISELTLSEWQLPEFTLDITCGSGTYIRSLAHDIGEVLGVGGYLSALARTASGAFTLENAVDLDTVLHTEDWRDYILPPDTALMDMPAVHLGDDDFVHVQHGRAPQAIDPAPPDMPFARAYSPQGDFCAIFRAEDGIWQPHKVFLSTDS